MIVLIVESVPPGLRGELSKWMLEPQAGVFVGNVSGAVRDLLWAKVCREAGVGNCTLVQPAANEQGYVIRTWGETSRQIEEWEGLFLVRRPKPKEKTKVFGEPPGNWDDYLHKVIWAKTARGVTLATGEPNFHPLSCHMIDTGLVTLRLWRQVLPDGVKEEIRQTLGMPDTESTGRWVSFLAGLHDLGKATPAFQRKWEEGWSRLVQEGYRNSDSHLTCPHYALSTYLLEDLLRELGLEKGVYVPIAAVVGAHHGEFPKDSDLNLGKILSGDVSWQKVQAELVQLLAHVLELDQLASPTGDLQKENGFLMILAGLCSVSDWIASNHDCFAYAGDHVQLPQYLQQADEQAERALNRLGWLNRPREMLVQDFSELFERVPNRLQQQVLGVAGQLNGPSLVLLEYPMGGGKTEAALWLADYLACTAGQKGLYFALPTMATSNQMFGRVNKYLSNRFPDSAINTMLLHGHASLNAEFALLQQRGRQQDEFQIEEGSKAGLLAAEWFTYRKRGLLAPYGIGTIDQALLSVLQTPHFFVRLFGLAGKVVVLDEVHAYDSYMQTLLAQLLSWLAACHASVVLLSATLPANTRQALLDAWADGRGQSKVSLPTAFYPRLTWLSQSSADSQHIEGATARSVVLHTVQLDDDLQQPQLGKVAGWMLLLHEQLQHGGCAAIILNTVGRAQAVYQHLKALFPADELLLFHARFPFDMRMEKEVSILERFGPEQSDRPQRAVVVATQVLEQSLDLDFDLMVTDLAPVDLVLQRSGRLWRHDRKRPEAFHQPTLWLLTPSTDVEGRPVFDRGSARVYYMHTLLRTWLVLRQKQSLEIPGAMDELIEAVYQETDAPGEISQPLQEMWRSTRALLEQQVQDEKKNAKQRHIRGVHKEIVTMPMKKLTEEGEEMHPALRALTRLGGPSVTVICLSDEAGDLYTVGPNRQQIVLRKPNQDELRSLLGCSLSISFAPDLVKRIFELEPPPEWGDSVHLRRCRLLTFDRGGDCLVPDLPLRLDQELGLYRKSGGKEENK